MTLNAGHWHAPPHENEHTDLSNGSATYMQRVLSQCIWPLCVSASSYQNGVNVVLRTRDDVLEVPSILFVFMEYQLRRTAIYLLLLQSQHEEIFVVCSTEQLQGAPCLSWPRAVAFPWSQFHQPAVRGILLSGTHSNYYLLMQVKPQTQTLRTGEVWVIFPGIKDEKAAWGLILRGQNPSPRPQHSQPRPYILLFGCTARWFLFLNLRPRFPLFPVCDSVVHTHL